MSVSERLTSEPPIIWICWDAANGEPVTPSVVNSRFDFTCHHIKRPERFRSPLAELDELKVEAKRFIYGLEYLTLRTAKSQHLLAHILSNRGLDVAAAYLASGFWL
jgi:hypothetical protein